MDTAGTEARELFGKSHRFYIAVVQGFFPDYYYTKESGFSFLIEEKPEYARHCGQDGVYLYMDTAMKQLY